MAIESWLLSLLVLLLGFWVALMYRRQHRDLLETRRSLNEASRIKRDLEERHTQNQTHWEQSEEKLRSYLQLMDTLMNTIPNPIYFKDAEGVYQGCNQVFAKRILGLTRDHIIGKRPRELPDRISSDLVARCEREEGQMVQKAEFHAFEAKVRCADGQSRDYLFSLAPVMDRQGELSGSVAVLSDLTDKNRAARNHIQKEKLEGVLETAGAVCHELNQPLQALSGYTEMMAMQLNGHPARPFVDKLTAQIERMRDITGKLQGVTRYETTDYAGNTKIIDIYKASGKE